MTQLQQELKHVSRSKYLTNDKQTTIGTVLRFV